MNCLSKWAPRFELISGISTKQIVDLALVFRMTWRAGGEAWHFPIKYKLAELIYGICRSRKRTLQDSRAPDLAPELFVSCSCPHCQVALLLDCAAVEVQGWWKVENDRPIPILSLSFFFKSLDQNHRMHMMCVEEKSRNSYFIDSFYSSLYYS